MLSFRRGIHRAIRRVQSIGEGIVSVPKRSSFGSRANIACMTAFVTAGEAMVRGLRSVCLLSLLAGAASAADVNIQQTLKGVEDRYNRAKTIRVTFTETYSAQRGKIVEKG